MNYYTFGDTGDVIYMLPVVRSLGLGELIFYPCRGRCREPFTKQEVEKVREFFEFQHYITGVRFVTLKPRVPASFDVILDIWRHQRYKRGKTLCQVMCDAHCTALPLGPWCGVDRPNKVAPYVFNRTSRYHDKGLFPWKAAVEKFGSEGVFVGTHHEHQTFTAEFGPVPYYSTPTLMDLARVVAGSELLICNQSTPRALAESMGKSVWMEISDGCPNCILNDRDATTDVNHWGKMTHRKECWNRMLDELNIITVLDRTLITPDRLRVLAQWARQCRELPGEYVELGSFRGGSAMLIATASGRKVHCFDNWNHGIPENDCHEGGHVAGDFAASLDDVQQYLGEYAILHPGIFPASAEGLDIPAVAYCHLDFDIQSATSLALDWVLPRLVPNAVLVLDDYGWFRCPGIKAEVEKRKLPVQETPGVYSQCWYMA